MLSYKWLLQLKKISYKPSCKTPYFHSAINACGVSYATKMKGLKVMKVPTTLNIELGLYYLQPQAWH